VRRILRSVLAMTTAVSLLAPAAALADEASTSVADATSNVAATPAAPTAERSAPPASVAVLGDSISAGTGSNGSGQYRFPGQERPRNSWATGDWPGLESVYQRIDALNGGRSASINLSENGRRSRDILGQIQRSPQDLEYVLIQIGGNDLCRPTVDQMTPTGEYRDNIDDALVWIEQNRPDTLVQLNAVPDIYRLWELRRTNFFARLFWGLGIIPCQSLLADAGSTGAAAEARRAAVRTRGLEYNDQLRELCEDYLRCRYDDDATWLFSNDPATFVTKDTSTQDYFHPSFQGQQKLAGVSWEAGFDFSDSLAPDVAFELDPASTDAGWNNRDVEVTVTATDDDGVAGLEVRTYDTDGVAGDWSTVFDDETTVTIAGEGTPYVEARAVDLNGNLSASAFQLVQIDETDPTISLEFPVDGGEVVLNEQRTVAYSCDDDRSGIASCTGTQATGAELDTATVGSKTVTVDALDDAGNTARVQVDYRVVYAVSAASDRVDGDGPIGVRRNAVLPVQVSLADAAGTEAADAAATLSLEGEDGRRLAAGSLTYDPVEDRYSAQVSLRRLQVQPGAYDLVAELDDGTERLLVRLMIR
jgi:lysophospholipase L1-like esterase